LKLRGKLDGNPEEGDEAEEDDEKHPHRHGHGVLDGMLG